MEKKMKEVSTVCSYKHGNFACPMSMLSSKSYYEDVSKLKTVKQNFWAVLPVEWWHSEKVRTAGVLLHPSATAEQVVPSSQQCNLATVPLGHSHDEGLFPWENWMSWNVMVPWLVSTPLSYCHAFVSLYTSRTSWVHVSTGTLWCGASPWALAPWTCASAPLQMPKQRFIVSTRFWTSPFKSLVLWSNWNGEYRTS